MGVKARSCHQGSSLRRFGMTPPPVFKPDDDVDAVMVALAPTAMTVNTPLTLGGALTDLPFAGTIGFRVIDAAGQNFEIDFDVTGYNADGIRIIEKLKLGPVTEATTQQFQTAGAFSWIESITPTRILNGAGGDSVAIGWAFASAEANPGGGLALPASVQSDDQFNAYETGPSGGTFSLVTVLKATDYSNRVWFPAVDATAQHYMFRFIPSVE